MLGQIIEGSRQSLLSDNRTPATEYPASISVFTMLYPDTCCSGTVLTARKLVCPNRKKKSSPRSLVEQAAASVEDVFVFDVSRQFPRS